MVLAPGRHPLPADYVSSTILANHVGNSGMEFAGQFTNPTAARWPPCKGIGLLRFLGSEDKMATLSDRERVTSGVGTLSSNWRNFLRSPQSRTISGVSNTILRSQIGGAKEVNRSDILGTLRDLDTRRL